MNRILHYILIALLGACFVSCEKGKDAVIEANLNAPFVHSATLATSSVNLDDTTANSHLTKLPNSQFTIIDTVEADVSNPAGAPELNFVGYRIYAPGASAYFASGIFRSGIGKPADSTANHRTPFSFSISRSDIGLYRIEIYAVNITDQVSNYLQIPLIISRNNSRPKTSHIIAPDTLVRPSSGTELISLSIAVTDSDGYGDIDLVFFKRISPPSANLFQLYDDGDIQIHGDQLAGDGTFSRIISIDQTAFLGDQLFVFLARDKSGALSDSLFHTITIIP